MSLENDLVLVYMDGSPAFFARIEAITEDVKPGWFQVKMLVLQIPLLVITWILREPYINGEEFTMGGHPMRLEKVVAPEEGETAASQPREETEPEGDMTDASSTPSHGPSKGKIVSLKDRRRKNHSP